MSIDQNRSAVAHLLRRAGFGASGAEIDAAAKAGYEATVSALLAPAGADPGAAATPPPNFPAMKAPKKGDAQADYQMVEWWLGRMASVTQPLAEKRTFFFHGHFATSIQKVKSPGFMVQQNQTMRTLGGGDFGALAHAMVRDPAMMLWLDSAGNTLKAPNENLARELMELFTLGVGNYTEDDVRAGARALTGWRLDPDGKATLVPRLHDDTPKTILGKTADFDDTSFVDWILQQPGSPKFVTGRFWNRFGMPGPDPAGRLRPPAGRLRTEPRHHRAAQSPVPRPRLPRPAGALRPGEAADGVRRRRAPGPEDQGRRQPASPRTTQALRTALTGLGQMPFYPPNVGGWPEGTAWLTTAAAQTRFGFAEWAVTKGDLSQVENSSPSQRIDAVAHLLGVDAFSDRSASALNEVVANPQQLVTLALLAPEYLVN